MRSLVQWSSTWVFLMPLLRLEKGVFSPRSHHHLGRVSAMPHNLPLSARSTWMRGHCSTTCCQSGLQPIWILWWHMFKIRMKTVCIWIFMCPQRMVSTLRTTQPCSHQFCTWVVAKSLKHLVQFPPCLVCGNGSCLWTCIISNTLLIEHAYMNSLLCFSVTSNHNFICKQWPGCVSQPEVYIYTTAEHHS